MTPKSASKMKITCLIKLFAFTSGLLLVASGCGHSSKQSIQGHWSGYNAKRSNYACTVNIAGNRLEYHGADSNDWARGPFVLHNGAQPNELDMTVLEPSKSSNQMIYAIYQVGGGEMTVAISSSSRPVDFFTNSKNEVFNFKRD